MPPRRIAAALVAAGSAAALLTLAPSAAPNGPPTADEVRRRVARWESEPTLRPFTALDPAAKPPPDGGTGRGLSLHIGLNQLDPQKYPGVPALEGCEHDARAMHDLAAARGYTPTLLVGEQATVAAVVAAIERASQALGPGDQYLITFSGHGSLVHDFTQQRRPRLTSQAFCLYDRMITDDEVISLWPKFREGVRVVFILDSCHSGTSDRAKAEFYAKLTGREPHRTPVPLRGVAPAVASGRGIRALRAEEHDRVLRVQEAELRRAVAGLNVAGAIRQTRATILRLAACKDDQAAVEAEDSGLFTAALLAVWDGGRFTGNHRDLIYRTAQQIGPVQEPSLDSYGIGAQELIDRRPFTP